MHLKCLFLVALSVSHCMWLSPSLWKAPVQFSPRDISVQCRGSPNLYKNQVLIIHVLGAFLQGLIHYINDWSRCTVFPFFKVCSSFEYLVLMLIVMSLYLYQKQNPLRSEIFVASENQMSPFPIKMLNLWAHGSSVHVGPGNRSHPL